MKWLKNNILTILCCIFLLVVFSQTNRISSILTKFVEPKEVIPLEHLSPYKKSYDFLYVQNMSSFSPLSKNDLKNILYTVVNSGWKSFTFYCPSEYKDCISDMTELSQNQDLITHMNNFVHPYLSFSNVRTILSESGEITIQVEYLYTEEQIRKINETLDAYIKKNIPKDMDVYDKIKIFHDDIINQTKYDVERNEHGSSSYLSYIAYGPLFEGYATCNGYTDIMAIYLSKLNITNYKVATAPTLENGTQGHVWNAVYLDENWLHLDLTWDDPVSSDGKDYLQHKYFLINNEALEKADQGDVKVLEHQYDSSIYLEFRD